jgi:hypothetical protein
MTIAVTQNPTTGNTIQYGGSAVRGDEVNQAAQLSLQLATGPIPQPRRYDSVADLPPTVRAKLGNFNMTRPRNELIPELAAAGLKMRVRRLTPKLALQIT